MSGFLGAFIESQDSALLVPMAAAADPILRVEGDNITVPGRAPFLGGALFGGLNITLGQIQSPSLRAMLNPDIVPLNVATEPVSRPAIQDWFAQPLPLVASEQIQAHAAEDGVGLILSWAMLWFVEGPSSPIQRPSYPLRATGATTLVANTWTNVSLTFTQTLASGRYQVVGMRANSTGLLAARLVFQESPFRPGVPGFNVVSDIDAEQFRHGGMGIMGEFAHDAPPTVDCLSLSADTAEVFHFDVVKVS